MPFQHLYPTIYPFSCRPITAHSFSPLSPYHSPFLQLSPTPSKPSNAALSHPITAFSYLSSHYSPFHQPSLTPSQSIPSALSHLITAPHRHSPHPFTVSHRHPSQPIPAVLSHPFQSLIDTVLTHPIIVHFFSPLSPLHSPSQTHRSSYFLVHQPITVMCTLFTTTRKAPPAPRASPMNSIPIPSPARSPDEEK